MYKILIFLLLLCIGIWTACAKASQKPMASPVTLASPIAPGEEITAFTKDTYPKFDGSTATIPLSEAFAAKLLGLSEKEAAAFVKHNKTHTAYVNLIQGKADIIFVTEPSPDERNIAKEAKVELEVIPVVKEGFVFMVNTQNPIQSLSIKQVQDIYSGKIKNWKAVGGQDKAIYAYQRDKNSGSQTLMESLVMQGIQLTEEPKNVISGMEGLISQIAHYETSQNAIGYSVYYYAKTMYIKDNIKLVSMGGVPPENKSIASGKYPFHTAYYAVLKKSDPKESPSRKLLRWILAKEGQNTAEKAGYVPVALP